MASEPPALGGNPQESTVMRTLSITVLVRRICKEETEKTTLDNRNLLVISAVLEWAMSGCVCVGGWG